MSFTAIYKGDAYVATIESGENGYKNTFYKLSAGREKEKLHTVVSTGMVESIMFDDKIGYIAFSEKGQKVVLLNVSSKKAKVVDQSKRTFNDQGEITGVTFSGLFDIAGKADEKGFYYGKTKLKGKSLESGKIEGAEIMYYSVADEKASKVMDHDKYIESIAGEENFFIVSDYWTDTDAGYDGWLFVKGDKWKKYDINASDDDASADYLIGICPLKNNMYGVMFNNEIVFLDLKNKIASTDNIFPYGFAPEKSEGYKDEYGRKYIYKYEVDGWCGYKDSLIVSLKKPGGRELHIYETKEK